MLLIANTIILRCTGNTNISTRVLIEIYTRDEIDAGTTCSVVLKLIGTKTSSRFLVMNPEGGEFPRVRSTGRLDGLYKILKNELAHFKQMGIEVSFARKNSGKFGGIKWKDIAGLR